MTRSLDVFFDLCLNKQLSKQSWGWWFETPSRPLRRHRNENLFCCYTVSKLISPWTQWPPFRRRYVQMHFREWKVLNLVKISLKFVPKGPIDKHSALFQVMAWRWMGDKPLSEPMLTDSLSYICGTRGRWVNYPIIIYILHRACALQNFHNWNGYYGWTRFRKILI